MLPRCDHFLIAETVAPMSDASASCDGHRASKSLGDSAGIDSRLGRFVLNDKAKVSYDYGGTPEDNAVMADRMSDTEEKLAFIRRTRLAREARFDRQKPMYKLLGIDQGLYKQYETRTPLPHRFIPRFCLIAGVDLEWLLTGEGKGPGGLKAMPERKTKAVKSDKTKGRAAA